MESSCSCGGVGEGVAEPQATQAFLEKALKGGSRIPLQVSRRPPLGPQLYAGKLSLCLRLPAGKLGWSVSKEGWAHTQDQNKNLKAGICEPQTEGGKEGSKERETGAPPQMEEVLRGTARAYRQHEQRVLQTPRSYQRGRDTPTSILLWEQARFSIQLLKVRAKIDHQEQRSSPPARISQGSTQWEIVKGQSPCSQRR